MRKTYFSSKFVLIFILATIGPAVGQHVARKYMNMEDVKEIIEQEVAGMK